MSRDTGSPTMGTVEHESKDATRCPTWPPCRRCNNHSFGVGTTPVTAAEKLRTPYANQEQEQRRLRRCSELVVGEAPHPEQAPTYRQSVDAESSASEE